MTPSTSMPLARICAYVLPDGETRIESREQRDGSLRWVVIRAGFVLHRKDLVFEHDPLPSSRTAEHLANTRFVTPEEAYACWEAVAMHPPKTTP